jgi:hypothetical protein
MGELYFTLTKKEELYMGFGGGSGGSSAIAGATDVALSSPSNSQLLQFNSATSKWQNGGVPGRLIELSNNVSSSGTAVTIPDTTTATINNVILTGNCTFSFPSAVAGKSFSIRITHSASGFNITWPSSVVWPNGVEPILTLTPAKKDIFSFICFTNGEWTGFTSGLNYV